MHITRSVLRGISKTAVLGFIFMTSSLVPSGVQALELKELVSPICFQDKAYMTREYGQPITTKWQRKDKVIAWRIQGDDMVSGYYPDSFEGKVASSATGKFGLIKVVVNCEELPESLIEKSKRNRDIVAKREQDLLAFEGRLQTLCLKNKKGIEAALGRKSKHYDAWVMPGEKTKEPYYVSFGYSDEDESLPMWAKVYNYKSWEEEEEVSCPMIREAAESQKEIEEAPMD